MATISLSAGVIVLAAGLMANSPILAKRQSIPANAQAISAVPAATFNSWFESGTPTLNGVVNPANSVTFPNNPGLANNDFYQWSYQMFLWATSPAPPSYGGGGGVIFNSPVFFDVSPPDAMHKRTLIGHASGFPRPILLRGAQVGFHGLPIVASKKGKLFELERPKISPRGKALVLNQAGQSTEISKATIVNGKARFLDMKGKVIPSAKLMIHTDVKANHFVQQFTINNRRIIFDLFGNIIETEEGQADGNASALLSQNGHLIYYLTIVNDVYAYFMTGTKDGGITPAPTQFPTTAADLAKITTFASGHGKTFPDPNALAVEFKTAWIDASAVPNPADYIKINIEIPTYDMSNPKHWVATAKTSKTLALIGMHVVGSAKGHPEMIWATFEHFSNAPQATYTFNATSGVNPHTVTQNTVGTWLFCASGASGPGAKFNVPIQGAQGDDIVSLNPPNVNIGPTNTLQFKPWGGASNQDPNPLVPNIATSNTQIISINNSVHSQLIGADVRKNYYFKGATWTIGGAPPSGAFPTGNEVGTSQLANSTMETFQQTTSSFDSTNNCFFCHDANTTSVSHVFFALKPLF